ncbi:hypothetical protein EMCRGX_G027992 [Ephydatia muelleri]
MAESAAIETLPGQGADGDVRFDSTEQSHEEDGDELVILDPSHPLMTRVQVALNAQLMRQNEKLEIDLKEKLEALKEVCQRRENLGVELYGVQQQLARQQMLMEKELDELAALKQIREQKELNLSQMKDVHQKLKLQLKNAQEQAYKLRDEMEHTGAKLHYLDEAYQTVQNDIALTKRAVEKTDVNVQKAQYEKLQQDLYLEKLNKQIYQLEDQIKLCQAQHMAQSEEKKFLREAVSEANMELEALQMEKKKLLQQWNSSLIGMARRDEAYSAMLAAMNLQKQQIISMDGEIENLKKSIIKEQERNENLTMLASKAEADIKHVCHQIEQSALKKDLLQKEYITFTSMLHEAEQSLSKTATECTMKMNELDMLRTQIEREAAEKRKLEDAVMEKLMQQLTMDKATKYTKKSAEKLRKRTEEIEIALSVVENESAQTSLQISEVASQLKRLQQGLNDQNEAIQKQNSLITMSEAEIVRNSALIERKQTQTDQLNKKILLKISKMEGGEDYGPLESKIEELQKKISDSLEASLQLQQFWLRQQNDVVKVTLALDDEAKLVDNLRKQLLILEQKKLRVDGALSQEQKECAQIQHSITSHQNDMIKLNTLIAEKRGLQERLEEKNVIAENDFTHVLKDAELECIELQTKVEQLNEEKERLLNSLIEAENQIMLWEKKIQIAKETHDAVDSNIGQAELKAMKSEIHRMQVRYEQLTKQQEKMIQDMEKCVFLTSEDAQTKRSIQQASADIAQHEGQIEHLTDTQKVLSSQLADKLQVTQKLKNESEEIERSLQQSSGLKWTGIAELSVKQLRLKQLLSAKDGKYQWLAKSEVKRGQDTQREYEKLQAVQAIIQKLEADFPSLDAALQPALTSVNTRIIKPTTCR